MACEGCLVSEKGQMQELQAIRSAAKKYALENEKTVAIYKEGFDWRFIEYQAAISLRLPIAEILSGHNRASTAPVH